MDTILEMLARRGEHLLGRLSGPLNFRLLIMPLVVTGLAIRAHLRDVREDRPTAAWAFFKDPTKRPRLFRSALKDVGKVFKLKSTAKYLQLVAKNVEAAIHAHDRGRKYVVHSTQFADQLGEFFETVEDSEPYRARKKTL